MCHDCCILNYIHCTYEFSRDHKMSPICVVKKSVSAHRSKLICIKAEAYVMCNMLSASFSCL